MDAILLARIQFAFTVGFHFLFPAMTLGTALIILITETFHYFTKDGSYGRITDFLAKLLGAIFVVGAASGVTMEFAFGNNWSRYARAVGDVFGPILAAEGVIAFFLESVFIGVLIFARNKVSGRVYWLSAFLVFIGGHLSAFWIVVANSWMQTPAGFTMTPEGKILLANFWQAVFNPSTIPRFIHTVLASWITCAVMVAGIGAYYILKGRMTNAVKKIFVIAMILFSITPLLQLVTGHMSAVQVLKTQQVKGAALEGHFDTSRGVPLYAGGWVDVKNEKTYGVGIPGLLSFLYDFNWNSEIKGLKEFPKENWPNVNFVFQTYHIMVAIGILLIVISLLGLYLLVTNKIYTTKWYLFILPFLIPLPHIAHETGWITAEAGRQPWIIYNIMKTADAASPVVPAGQILFSLIMFALIYLLLFITFITVFLKIVKHGIDEKAA